MDSKLAEAVRKLLGHLQKSTESALMHPGYLQPAEQLRRQADVIERRDKDIEHARELLKEFDYYNATKDN